MIFIGLTWEEIFSVYQIIIIENDVYMWAADGTLNVSINKRLCKYNVTKFVTFITETLYIYTIIVIHI